MESDELVIVKQENNLKQSKVLFDFEYDSCDVAIETRESKLLVPSYFLESISKELKRIIWEMFQCVAR